MPCSLNIIHDHLIIDLLTSFTQQLQTHSAMDYGMDRHIDPNTEEVIGKFPCDPSICDITYITLDHKINIKYETMLKHMSHVSTC